MIYTPWCIIYTAIIYNAIIFIVIIIIIITAMTGITIIINVNFNNNSKMIINNY